MTDNEIIKALECCTTMHGNEACRECPFRGKCLEDDEILTKESLSLINRQKAENDYWKRNAFDGCMERSRIEKTAKAEAIKEFAERLKTHTRKMQSSDFSGEFWDKAVLVSDIDNLVNEMVGDNDG